jgi:multidrug efflux pump subunit AcrA (membrane-fusion protein)
MYRVSAPFTFVATERRIVSAPYDGFVSDVVKVKPGDTVKQGDVLLELKTDELKLQLAQAKFRANSKRLEAEKYLSDPTKTAERKQALVEASAFQAEADLLQHQIDQAVIRAPIDGLVFAGDWKDKRNMPVQKGDELFKIGQKESFKLKIDVTDRDIQSIKQGAAGKLATKSLPDEKLPFTVDQIIPLPDAQGGENVFTVYAIPETFDPAWREGLKGEANIDVEERSLLWQKTHRFVDWLKLKLWSMGLL